MIHTFSPDNEWFIETMNSVFEVGGEYVRKEVAFNLMRLIAEGNYNPVATYESQVFIAVMYM